MPNYNHSNDAVVDTHGKVQGMDNLYIVDSSIFPTIPTAPISSICMAVANKIIPPT